MPNALGHLITGTALGVVTAHDQIGLSLVLFGSLLPDIDHRCSTLGKFNPLTRLMKHRGKCHTVIGSALLCGPFLFLGVYWFALALVGAIGHLLADKLMSTLPRHSKFKLRIW